MAARICNSCGASYDPLDGAYRRSGKCQTCTAQYEAEKRSRQRRARSSSDYQHARQAALQAAGYRCTRCGSTDRVETHHAVARPGQPGDNSEGNLVVLCQRCHLAQHSRPTAQPRSRFSRQTLTDTGGGTRTVATSPLQTQTPGFREKHSELAGLIAAAAACRFG
jgi:5-methylcytosine-specific restriction endonuclease McrA